MTVPSDAIHCRPGDLSFGIATTFGPDTSFGTSAFDAPNVAANGRTKSTRRSTFGAAGGGVVPAPASRAGFGAFGGGTGSSAAEAGSARPVASQRRDATTGPSGRSGFMGPQPTRSHAGRRRPPRPEPAGPRVPRAGPRVTPS